MNGGEASAPGNAAHLPGSGCARALMGAVAWSAEIVVRFGEPSGRSAALFLAALGSTALTLGTVAVVARREAGARAVQGVLGALLVSGPVAFLARVLRGQTHHRALGGVTFALLAAMLVVFGVLVVRRTLRVLPHRPSRRGSALAMILVTGVSVAVALVPLGRELGVSGSPPDRWLAEDLAVGLLLSGLVAAAPRLWLPRRTALVFVAAWAISVATGTALLASDASLRAILAARAPVALGVLTASSR